MFTSYFPSSNHKFTFSSHKIFISHEYSEWTAVWFFFGLFFELNTFPFRTNEIFRVFSYIGAAMQKQRKRETFPSGNLSPRSNYDKYSMLVEDSRFSKMLIILFVFWIMRMLPQFFTEMGTRVLGLGLESRSCWTRTRVLHIWTRTRTRTRDMRTRTRLGLGPSGLDRQTAQIRIDSRLLIT